MNTQEVMDLLDKLTAKRAFHRQAAAELESGAPEATCRRWDNGTVVAEWHEPPAPEKAEEHRRKLQHIEDTLAGFFEPSRSKNRLVELRALAFFESSEKGIVEEAEKWAKQWIDSHMRGGAARDERDELAEREFVGVSDRPTAWIEVHPPKPRIWLNEHFRLFIAIELVSACVRLWRVRYGGYLTACPVDDPEAFVGGLDAGWSGARGEGARGERSGKERPKWLVEQVVRALRAQK